MPTHYKRLLMWLTMSLAITSLIIYGLYQSKKSQNEIDPAVYLWSKRVFDLNNYNLLSTGHISTQNDIAQQIRLQNKVLWIRNTSSNSNTLTDLDHLGALLHLIEEPVILVTSDGDRDVPSSYNPELVKTLLSSPKIIKWYTQNYDKSIIHPKLTHYPIGLDMHSSIFMKRKTLKILDKIKSDADLRAQKFNYYLITRDKHQYSKKNKIFCDSHLSKTHPRRQEMFEILKNNTLIDFQNKRVHYTKILDKYAQYRFIISPRGAGLDCHRTWEAFLLGSIVIMESSSLDDMFIKNDLPVIILKDFSELNNVTEEQLEEWYNTHKHKTEKNKILQKFTPEYWVQAQ